MRRSRQYSQLWFKKSVDEGERDKMSNPFRVDYSSRPPLLRARLLTVIVFATLTLLTSLMERGGSLS